jgi:hypothetical protein
LSICASLCSSTMICTASPPRPVSKKIKKSSRSSASSLFHHPLPPLRPPRQLSLNSDLLDSSPSTPTSSTALPTSHKNPRSKTSFQKFRPLPVWLPAQAFSCTVPSSSPKTIKWSSLLNQFSGATIRLPAPGAAIRFPVRPPSDWSHMSPLRSSKS